MPNLPESAIRITNDIELWEIPNFATPEECDEIINEAHRKGFQVSEVDDPKNAVTQSRTSTTAFLTSNEAPVTQKIGLRAKEIVGPYELEGLQVQKYEKTQKYNPHYDTFDGKDGKEQRNYTAMLYLNDVPQGNGGYTLFTKLNLRLIPKKGSLILWNNLLNDNCRDENTMHMGEPVEGDVVKYITTFWFHKTDSEFCSKKIVLVFVRTNVSKRLRRFGRRRKASKRLQASKRRSRSLNISPTQASQPNVQLSQCS